jgi:hypothetical protein
MRFAPYPPDEKLLLADPKFEAVYELPEDRVLEGVRQAD